MAPKFYKSANLHQLHACAQEYRGCPFGGKNSSARIPIREIIFLTSDKINGEVASRYSINCFLLVKKTEALAARLTSACHKIIDWISTEKPNFSLAIRSSASSSYVAWFIDNILPFFHEVREVRMLLKIEFINMIK